MGGGCSTWGRAGLLHAGPASLCMFLQYVRASDGQDVQAEHSWPCPSCNLEFLPFWNQEGAAFQAVLKSRDGTEGFLRSWPADPLGFSLRPFWCRLPGIFQHTKLFLSEQAGRAQAIEFLRKNAANSISMANLLMGLLSVLCSLNG